MLNLLWDPEGAEKLVVMIAYNLSEIERPILAQADISARQPMMLTRYLQVLIISKGVILV